MYLKTTQQFDDTCFSHLYKNRGSPLFYITLKRKVCIKIEFVRDFDLALSLQHKI